MHPSYAVSLGNIGNIYDSKGDYDKALEYYFKSIEI
jgi:tetratricopeptide (TPR) repeat protein